MTNRTESHLAMYPVNCRPVIKGNELRYLANAQSPIITQLILIWVVELNLKS